MKRQTGWLRAASIALWLRIERGPWWWVLPVNAFEAPAEADRPPLPLIPELDDPDCVVQDIFRDLPMDYGTLLENVMDVSHVPFTHHNSVGKRENATPVVLEMEGKLKPGGFTAGPGASLVYSSHTHTH